MKEQANHGFVPLEALTATPSPVRQWRSAAEYVNVPVPEAEQFDEAGVPISDSSRRRFLGLMAGSMGLAGLTGCTRQPTEKIMPYGNQPENVVPGNPKYYATAVPVAGVAEGVIVESHLGRPTKVEGNPDHPASLGASSVGSQACLMDLYDPDRAKEIVRLEIPSTWDTFIIDIDEALRPIRANKGAGLRILTETV